jgi:peptide subunit release factor 1 (eRF1)
VESIHVFKNKVITPKLREESHAFAIDAKLEHDDLVIKSTKLLQEKQQVQEFMKYLLGPMAAFKEEAERLLDLVKVGYHYSYN